MSLRLDREVGVARRTMELLAPAGGREQLEMAIHFGADAVYLAGRRWGMRSSPRNFADDELGPAVAFAHERGVSAHVALNTLMTDADIDELPRYLRLLDSVGADAAIVSDLGALALLREHAPRVAPHVSTQASVMNAVAAEQWLRLGARRVVLAREMTIAQIADLRRRTSSELELEVFAHGSVCMAYSGRCLLSAELMGDARSASRGACAQPCRWAWSLVEDREPSRPVSVETDARGSYLLSSNDLCAIGLLDDLAEAGVDAVKLEGRAKGSYYVACVTNAYRHVLDGEPVAPWRAELDLVSHRPYSTGFLLGDPTQNPGRDDYVRERRIVAVVGECERTAGGWATDLVCRNRAEAGDGVAVLCPGRPVRGLSLPAGLVRNGETYHMVLPFETAPLDLVCLREPDERSGR